jgi:exopolysaccharide biosynthesis polyprenyl glycosylphosphotransferase
MVAERNRPLRGLVLVLDALIVVGAMALAAGLHAAFRGHFAWFREPPRLSQYALIIYLSVPLWLVLISLLGLHRTFERAWTRLGLILDLLKLHLLGFIGLSSALFLTQTVINRSLVALFLGCSFVLLYAGRSGLGVWQRYQHNAGQTRTRLLFIGDETPQLQTMLATASARPHPPLLVGSLGNHDIVGLKRLGTLGDLERVLHEEALDLVLFFPPFDEPDDVAQAITACETVGVAAEVAIDISHPAKAPPRVHELFGRPFLSFDPAPKPAQELAMKHALDWLIALVAVVLLAPVLLIAGLAILLTMGRPVFFTQARAGLNGRQFRMIKFRTMVKDAEAHRAALNDRNEMTGPVFKVTGDPRITRLGTFLRKSSIDELPQLFNVLLGQMSLVGPRPLPISEQRAIRGWHRRRLSMKPGITGVWQISGRNNIDFEQWMQLDQQYVDDWSLLLDATILLKTIPVVLLGRGAK